MFSKLHRWIQNNREYDFGQKALWPKATIVEQDGLTAFQHQAKQKLFGAFGPIELRKEGVTDFHLCGNLASSEIVVYIYSDGVQIHKNSKILYGAEREDHANPQSLIDEFVAKAITYVSDNHK